MLDNREQNLVSKMDIGKDMERDLGGFRDRLFSAAREAYREVADRTSNTVSEFNSKASNAIRRYPVQVTIGALAIGFLAGAALLRSRRFGVES